MSESPTRKQAPTVLLKLLQAQRIGDLDWYYEVGQCVLKIFPKTEGQHYYGNGIEGLAHELKDHGGSRGLLYKARQFADCYRPQDLRRLKPLTWTHIKKLLEIKSPRVRETLERQCLTKGWNTTKLSLQIRERQQKTSHGGQKPNPMAPDGAQGALRELQRFVDHWEAHYAKWIESQLTSLLAKKSAELGPELDRAIAGLNRVELTMAKTIEELKQLSEAARLRYRPRRSFSGPRRQAVRL